MEKAVLDTIRANALKDAYIRLIVTRGVGDLGLDPAKCPKPSVIIIADKISLYPEEYYTKGLTLITASTRRNIPDAINPRIKSLNYLNNIVAKLEAKRAGVPEAIMLNPMGFVAECTGDNVFIIKGNKIITPPLWAGGLEGITRGVVMALAKKKLNLDVAEDNFTVYDIYTADECFLTGTAAEVIPVVKLDLRKIGNGKPGKTTLDLIKEFRKETQANGTKI
jgi:branched-chain amino acid aminotransferase